MTNTTNNYSNKLIEEKSKHTHTTYHHYSADHVLLGAQIVPKKLATFQMSKIQGIHQH